MHLCNIPNAYIILQKNKKYTVSTLLTALKNFVTDLVPSEIVCFDNSGKRVGYHTHILIIFDDMHSKELIHVMSQSHVKLFWVGWSFFCNSTRHKLSPPHTSHLVLTPPCNVPHFQAHQLAPPSPSVGKSTFAMCYVSKLTNPLPP